MGYQAQEKDNREIIGFILHFGIRTSSQMKTERLTEIANASKQQSH